MPNVPASAQNSKFEVYFQFNDFTIYLKVLSFEQVSFEVWVGHRPFWGSWRLTSYNSQQKLKKFCKGDKKSRRKGLQITINYLKNIKKVNEWNRKVQSYYLPNNYGARGLKNTVNIGFCRSSQYSIIERT